MIMHNGACENVFQWISYVFKELLLKLFTGWHIFLALFRLKAFSHDNFDIPQMVPYFFTRVENIVSKGENATWSNQHFHLFLMFFKGFFPRFVNPFPNDDILDFSKFKACADDNFEFDENDRKFSKRVENTVRKGELLVASNFSFTPSVFKRLVLQTRKNQGLFGKGLNFSAFMQ